MFHFTYQQLDCIQPFKTHLQVYRGNKNEAPGQSDTRQVHFKRKVGGKNDKLLDFQLYFKSLTVIRIGAPTLRINFLGRPFV